MQQDAYMIANALALHRFFVLGEDLVAGKRQVSHLLIEPNIIVL